MNDSNHILMPSSFQSSQNTALTLADIADTGVLKIILKNIRPLEQKYFFHEQTCWF